MEHCCSCLLQGPEKVGRKEAARMRKRLPALLLVIVLPAAAAPLVSGKSKPFRERTGGAPMFRLPVENPEGAYFSGPRVNLRLDLVGVDHKPTPKRDGLFARALCKDYKGRALPHCYGNHKGTDFILRGGFKTMDRGLGRVVAAADGVVTRAVDGNFDRCRLGLLKMGVSCRGHDKKPNLVWIKHDNGYSTRYYHFKKHTIAVRRGQRVECGQFLGYVGSSGESVVPHLHFEVRDPQGFALDPYSKDPQSSLWVEQNGPRGLPGERCAGY